MSFTWKSHNDIFKGEGIYHLTFVVHERRALLGELVDLAHSRAYGRNVERSQNIDRKRDTDGKRDMGGKAKYTCKLATTELSSFGFAVLNHLMQLQGRYDEGALKVCAKQFLPDHLHVVIWIKADVGKSIRQIAQGFRIGIRNIAHEMGVWDKDQGHPFEIPFIRTLSRAGQLRTMIDYVHANPDNAWMRRLHPDLYTIHRNMEYCGLHFDTMGKSRLLDYPDKQVIALSRSLTDEDVAHEVNKALLKAKAGMVTLTAAVNKGEKAVARAVREAGYPLVVMMLDGFPPEGTEAARYFHPSGVYHKACGEGRLYLMAPLAENYDNPNLIEQTEAELVRKAAEKGQRYYGIPHTSTRWRMIAGNVMLGMLGMPIMLNETKNPIT